MTLDPDEFQAGIVEMIAVSSISINYFKSYGFQRTTGILANAIGISTSPAALISCITNVAHAMREIIRTELAKKKICIKFDAATRHNRKIKYILQYTYVYMNKINV